MHITSQGTPFIWPERRLRLSPIGRPFDNIRRSHILIADRNQNATSSREADTSMSHKQEFWDFGGRRRLGK
jgi:hypothetical protein